MEVENIQSSSFATLNVVDTSALHVTKLKILRLFEFYFSDSEIKSLLANKVMKDVQDVNGWIPITKFTSFARVKDLTQNINVIVAALKDSKLLELSQDFNAVRRKDLPENILQGLLNFKAIFVRDLQSSVNDEEVRIYFSQFGTVESVKRFKNGIAVDFSTEAEADRVVSLKHFYNCEQFTVEYRKRNHLQRTIQRRIELSGKKRKHKALDETKTLEVTRSRSVSAHDSVTFGYDTNRILKICRVPQGVNKENIRNVFSKYGPLQAIDYNPPSDIAYLRYSISIASEVVEAVAKAGGISFINSPPSSAPIATSMTTPFNAFLNKLSVPTNSSTVELKALKGDEEHMYYQTLNSSGRSTPSDVQAITSRSKKKRRKGKLRKLRTPRTSIPALPVMTSIDLVDSKKRFIDSDNEDFEDGSNDKAAFSDSDEEERQRRKKFRVSEEGAKKIRQGDFDSAGDTNTLEDVVGMFVGLKA